MKKIIILFFTFLTCICTPIDAATKGEGDNRIDVSTRVAVGEYWGERWNSKDNRIFISIRDNKFVITLYPRTEEVWNHYCKITISDFMIPDKKIRQEHVKKSLDYIYECTVDFYYNVEYPSLEECFANYGGFANRGYEISALFDTDESLKGSEIAGVPVMMYSELENYVKTQKPTIAILAVPKTAVLGVADDLVSFGMKSFLNFAYVDLQVPDEVVVENVHLSDSMMTLSYRMATKDKNQ